MSKFKWVFDFERGQPYYVDKNGFSPELGEFIDFFDSRPFEQEEQEEQRRRDSETNTFSGFTRQNDDSKSNDNDDPGNLF